MAASHRTTTSALLDMESPLTNARALAAGLDGIFEQQAHDITGQLHADAHRLVYMLTRAIAEIDDAWNRTLASQQGGLQAYALSVSTDRGKDAA